MPYIRSQYLLKKKKKKKKIQRNYYCIVCEGDCDDHDDDGEIDGDGEDDTQNAFHDVVLINFSCTVINSKAPSP